MREPHLSRIAGAGVELQLYEWPGDGRTVLLAHATGFHGRCWQQVAELLPGLRIIALDLRGHGLSDKPVPPYDWHNFALDTAAVVRGLGIEGAVGVGHSGGGFAIYAGAVEAPGAFAAILGVDPVISDPAAPPAARSTADPGEHFTARRRDRFASPEEMFERFKERGPYNTWKPEVLWDYCLYGLVPAADGDGYQLACPPLIEAAVYLGAAGTNRLSQAQLDQLHMPVRVLRAKPSEPGARDMSGSPTWPGLAAALKYGEDVPLPQYSHFIPMEAPDVIARHIRELAAL